MWLWILSVIFLLLVWSAWFFLQPPEGVVGPEIFPTWVALTMTAVVVVALVGLIVYRRIRARRAARALEKAIAQQAQDQVLATKPEDRAEIQELQRQMLDGIKALKASKLGEGQGNALYNLPWYAIVGPPGAGKTTALRHSGLSFPYLDPNGGGVRGVGGTRNCDWWFTNDAILLDTAGRYTTEQDDHDEWMAFLGFLKNYRKHKPLNGVIVAVSVSELIDATEDEIEQVADRVRDRIDEMQEQLKMVLPIYVMFTKCDLVAGFVEFFGDFKRSERGQPWGATFPLKLAKDDPENLFNNEFDLLVEQLHKRTVNRMRSDRASRAEKEKVYQFPLEFAAVKRNLAEFMKAAFRPATPPASKKAIQIPTPILRGFYFTSGTQEGKPLDRVVGAMGRAFGLRPVEAEEQVSVESKSFFLKEVFTDIVFPDHDVAGRTEDEIKRVRLQRILVAAIACAVACLLMVPAIFSFLDNRALIQDTQKITDEVGAIDWTKGELLPKIEQLDTLRAHVEQLGQWRDQGAPISMRWGMYQGDKLFEPALEQYIAALRHGFILKVKEDLETKLKTTAGARYLEEHNVLKTYLLLNDPLHLKTYERWQVGRLTQAWATILRPHAGNMSERDLRNKLVAHTSYYVALLRGLLVKGEELDAGLIASTRDILTRVGASQRLYDQFVTVLEDQKIDEAGGNIRDNLRYKPITLASLFEGHPEALTILSSKRVKNEKLDQKVRGPYTYAGHEAVLASLKDGTKILDREKWVVPLGVDEKNQPKKIEQALKRLRVDYDTQYIREWTEFFQDLEVAIPQNNIDSISEFKILSTPDWPYWRLLRALRDNTQFEQLREKGAADLAGDSGVLDQIKRRVRRKIDSRAGRGVGKLLMAAGLRKKVYQDPIPLKFEKMVGFGFPPVEKKDEPPPPSQLGTYIQQLEQLAAEMMIIEEGPPGSDPAKATELFEGAVKTTEQKLLSMDRFGQDLLRDLLLNPLRQSYKAMLKSAGGAASGLWEVSVWPPYRDTIKNRYPFNSAAKRDASFEDAIAFLKPKEGILWGFYTANLKGFHRKIEHKFVPATHLAGSRKPAKRFTPFNANMYNCLERADEITDALFAQGDPKVVFRVNLTTVSPIVSEIAFEVDGVKRRYRNEREFWHTMQWPGPDGPTGASITIRGAGGLTEEIRRDGPWGLFRLLEAGRHRAKQDDDKGFSVEWQMSAPPVVVKMEMRPTRANHPFPLGFFRDTNCPSSIGDRFGG